MAKVRAWTALWVIGAWACGGDEGEITAGRLVLGETRVAAEVDLEGASLRLESGVELVVPRDALMRPVTVEMEEVASDGLPRVQRGEGVASPCVFRPHGQRFDRPVLVSWPIDEVAQGQQLRMLRLDDEDDTEWEEVGDVRVRRPETLNAEELERSGGRPVVELTLRGFSIYWPVAAEPAVGVAEAGAGTQEGGSTPSDGGAAALDSGEPDGAAGADGSATDPDAGGQPDGSTTVPDAGGGAGDGSTALPDAGEDAGVDATLPDAGVPADATTEAALAD